MNKNQISIKSGISWPTLKKVLDLPLEDIKSFDERTIESMDSFNFHQAQAMPNIKTASEAMPEYKIPEVFESLKDEIVKDCTTKLTQKLESLLIQHLSMFVPSGFDMKAEMKRTFPRILRKTGEDHSEEWWWNDGSETGQLIMTIYPAKILTNINQSSLSTCSNFACVFLL
jgi:hypothetical protein